MTASTERPGTSVRTSRALSLYTRQLWTLAALLYVGGDLVTTVLGLRYTSLCEVGPVAGVLLGEPGVGGLVALKLLVFGVFVAVWRALPEPAVVGVPLGLAVAGYGITLWNATLIAVLVV